MVWGEATDLTTTGRSIMQHMINIILSPGFDLAVKNNRGEEIA